MGDFTPEYETWLFELSPRQKLLLKQLKAESRRLGKEIDGLVAQAQRLCLSLPAEHREEILRELFGHTRADRRGKVLFARKMGLSARETARVLQVSHTTVYNDLNRRIDQG